MMTHSQKRVMLDELNHVRTGYNCFAALARKRFPEPPSVEQARRRIKRDEKIVQRHADRVEKFRKAKEVLAFKLRADVRKSIEFDDVKTVQQKLTRYIGFVKDA